MDYSPKFAQVTSIPKSPQEVMKEAVPEKQNTSFPDAIAQLSALTRLQLQLQLAGNNLYANSLPFGFNQEALLKTCGMQFFEPSIQHENVFNQFGLNQTNCMTRNVADKHDEDLENKRKRDVLPCLPFMNKPTLNFNPFFPLDANASAALQYGMANYALEQKAKKRRIKGNEGRQTVKHSSHYKGVHWNKACKAWRAQISVRGKTEHLGNFDNEEEAAREYDKRARELGRGGLNFCDESNYAHDASSKRRRDRKKLVKDNMDLSGAHSVSSIEEKQDSP